MIQCIPNSTHHNPTISSRFEQGTNPVESFLKLPEKRTSKTALKPRINSLCGSIIVHQLHIFKKTIEMEVTTKYSNPNDTDLLFTTLCT